jgi:hypothetical protein
MGLPSAFGSSLTRKALSTIRKAKGRARRSTAAWCASIDSSSSSDRRSAFSMTASSVSMRMASQSCGSFSCRTATHFTGIGWTGRRGRRRPPCGDARTRSCRRRHPPASRAAPYVSALRADPLPPPSAGADFVADARRPLLVRAFGFRVVEFGIGMPGRAILRLVVAFVVCRLGAHVERAFVVVRGARRRGRRRLGD